MSISSLPGIFRQSQLTTATPRKQGASFSLQLSPFQAQRSLASRSASKSNRAHLATVDAVKPRSISSSILKNRETAISDENITNNMFQRSKNQVAFVDQFILWQTSPPKRRKGPAIINISNVVYETSRGFNNRMLELEQADSLKNMTELRLKQLGIIQSQLQEAKQVAKLTHAGFMAFIEQQVQDLQAFQDSLTLKLRNCYSALSRLRRQTNEETRANKKQLEKVANQLSVCDAVLKDLSLRGQQIACQTIKVQPQFVQSIARESFQLDFEDISEIPKTSRGGTGNISRRTRLIDLLSKNEQPRKSVEWDVGLQLGDLQIN